MKNQPSVASLVWSFDSHAMKYAAFSSIQEPRQEGIEDLGLMMKVYHVRCPYACLMRLYC